MNYVLVPGAWAGSWCWVEVAVELRRLGHAVLLMALPGLRSESAPATIHLRDHVAAVAQAVNDFASRSTGGAGTEPEHRPSITHFNGAAASASAADAKPSQSEGDAGKVSPVPLNQQLLRDSVSCRDAERRRDR